MEKLLAGGSCDWVEDANTLLQTRRWYASNTVLPDGSYMIVGGQNVFTYEFIPARPAGQVLLPFLQQTHKVFGDEENLYPFVHLMPSGDVFIFARRDAILLDPNSGDSQSSLLLFLVPFLHGVICKGRESQSLSHGYRFICHFVSRSYSNCTEFAQNFSSEEWCMHATKSISIPLGKPLRRMSFQRPISSNWIVGAGQCISLRYSKPWGSPLSHGRGMFFKACDSNTQ